MTIDEMIAVLQAAKVGKKIQYYENDIWCDLHGDYPHFIEEYRVKPEPREWWIHPISYPDCEYEGDRILDKQPKNPAWIHVREVIECNS